ncbi:hypothetical protein PENSPDRAFT_621794 [Peniophora sp. CONT]|nr:hypothetical protein PENSPDRAFT_621794 [Peniophora sp. CONT]
MSPFTFLPSPLSTPLAVLLLALSYLLFVRLTRRRLYNHVHRKYAHRVADLDALTPAEAQDIMHATLLWDTPSVVFNALSFAIVRTYAIPSISRILCGTKELQSDTVSKRYMDTAIIVATCSTCPFNTKEPPSDFYAAFSGIEGTAADPRAYVAIARMNWLHEHYSISNDDYMFTLALIVFLPINWAKRFGWRALSPLEVHARYVFWRHIGELMHIRDIPGSPAEFEAWAEQYESRCMVPADTNHALAEGMLNELASALPAFARPLFKRLTICMMDERMRRAMKLPAQPRALHALVDVSAAFVRFAGRHLLPPRPYPYCVVPVKAYTGPKRDDEVARMHPLLKVTKPWYLPRATGIWRALENVTLVLGLRAADDIPGPKFDDEGYRLEELGPARWKNSGHADVMQKAGEMMGCPVQGAWARDSTKATSY